MDSQTSGTAPCPTCGEQRTAGHTCPNTEPTDVAPVETGDTSSSDTGRIQIPEALLNTGLFRAAWKPSSTQASAPVDNYFERVEDPTPAETDREQDQDVPAAEEKPTDQETPVAQEPPAAQDPFLAPLPEDVEPTVQAEPSAPIDPWAGLDLKVTEPVTNTEAPIDPWADLQPAGAFVEEREADDTEAADVEATEPEVAEPEAEEVEEVEADGAFVAANFTEVSADEVTLHESPDDVASDADVSLDENDDEAPAQEDPALEDPAQESPEDDAEPAAAEPELTPIAAAEAAARAAAAQALVPPPLPAQPFAPLAEADDEDAAEPAVVEPAVEADVEATLEETAAMDMVSALSDGPTDLEPLPEPEVSAFDLYGDSLYAPETTVVDANDDDVAAGVDTASTAVVAAAPALPEVSLSAAGVTSASLPESVPFAPGIGLDGNPQEPSDEAPVPEKRRINKGIAAAVAGVVLVAAGGGWFWWNGQKDAPVKEAFAASHGGFTTASTQLRQASSISDIATAGASFETNLDLQRATDQKTRENNSEVSLAARRAAVAEAAVAAAAAPLKDLSSSDLSAWAETQDVLRESVEGLEAVREDIETAGGSTDALPTVEVVDKIQETIADEVVQGASETVTALAAKLESASLLADIRAVGASAGEYVGPLSDAAAGIDDPAQKDELQAVVEFHEALSGFSKLRPATLDSWNDRLKEAEKAAANLSDESRADAEAGLAAVDATVKASIEKFEKWETRNAEAKATKEADLADLETAITTVEGATSTLTTLDGELDAILEDAGERTEEGEPNTVAARLAAAAGARESLLADLEALTVVPRAEAELKALVDIVSADAEAVRAAATAAQDCVDNCVPRSRPQVSALGARTTVESWNAAVGFWDSQSESATEAVQKRKLPARPKI